VAPLSRKHGLVKIGRGIIIGFDLDSRRILAAESNQGSASIMEIFVAFKDIVMSFSLEFGFPRMLRVFTVCYEGK
jgi:hypothetical protein